MAMVCVCVTVSGGLRYFLAARQAFASVLDRTPFELFAAVGSGPAWLLPAHPSLQMRRLADLSNGEHRSAPFLRKFDAITACLRQTSADYLLLLDADTVVTGRIDASDVERALDGHPLAMAEQIGIRGSAMNRAGFLEHYRAHTLAWVAPALPAPELARFRFFNSGVVLGTRAGFERLTAWALDTIGRLGPRHEVGRHMIADQDYFQAWTNTLHPESCRTLGWEWNHCEHWDEGFPRRDALICHFSNFCNGPTVRTLARMAWARRPWLRT